MAKKFRIRKGDRVVVVTGRNKGKTGEVLQVLRDTDRVLVQGVNMIKRHTAPSQVSPGGIMEKEAPLHISNVCIYNPTTGSADRVGFKTLEDGRKVRYFKSNGEIVDV